MNLGTLQASNIWLVWKSGRTTKIPYGADDPSRAGSFKIGTDEKYRPRLATYNQAAAAYRAANAGFDGVGFVFTKMTDNLYICGIDIDHQALDSDFVKSIIALFPNAYIERSPSGEGVHIVLLVDVSRIPTERVTESGKERVKLASRY
jgi:primase-polymerase (primpol)-like protein